MMRGYKGRFVKVRGDYTLWPVIEGHRPIEVVTKYPWPRAYRVQEVGGETNPFLVPLIIAIFVMVTSIAFHIFG